jgi:hypothetical protein
MVFPSAKRKQKRTPKETPAAYAQRKFNIRLKRGPPPEPIPTVFATREAAAKFKRASTLNQPAMKGRERERERERCDRCR